MALLVRIPLAPFLGDRVPFITIFMVMLVLVMLVRAGPFLVSSMIGLVGAAAMFPVHFLGFETPALVELSLFALTGIIATIVAWLAQRQQARHQAIDAMLRAFVDDSPTCKCVADPKGLIIYANRAMAEALGRPIEKIIGRTHAEILPPKLAELAVKHIRSVCESGQPCASFEELEPLNETAAPRVLEWRRFTLRLNNDEHALVAGMANDVTERTRIEGILRQNEQRLNTLSSILADVPWSTSADGKFVEPQEAYARYTGKPWEELRGHGWLNCIHPDDREKVNRIWQQAVATKSIYNAHCREWHGPTQEWRHVIARGAPVLDANGSVSQWVGTLIDVHDQTLAEEALRESEERFALLANSAPALIWINGPDGAEFVNRTYLDFLGVDGDVGVRGYDWTKFIHAEDRDNYVGAYLRAAEQQAPFDAEFRFRRHDGEYRWMRSVAQPRISVDGTFLGYAGVTIDVSERKQAEEALRRQQEILEKIVRQRTDEAVAAQRRLIASERMASIGTLSAGIGHDIGNVLVPMRAHLSLIQAALDKTPDKVALIDSYLALNQGFEYLSNLNSSLRMLAHDPDRKPDPNASTKLNDWRIATEPLLRAVTGSGIELNIMLPNGLPPVMIADHLLTQVIVNLVQNAAQAMQGAANANGEDARRIVLLASIKNDKTREVVVITVSDNGPGMTEEVRRRCLEPFFTTKTRGISSGLGLAIVNGIIQNIAGGELRFDSERGKGTTFFITLPTKSVENKSSRKRATICVADPRRRAIVKSILNSMGCEVSEDSFEGNSEDVVRVNGKTVVISQSATPNEVRNLLREIPA